MKKKTTKDPFYKREKAKYGLPVPSREWIITTLEAYGRPMSSSRLIESLEVVGEELQQALSFRLKAMLRDGQIMQDRRGRFCLVNKINLLRGVIQGHADGFGFFIPDDGSQDLVLSPKDMRWVMHGDSVLAYEAGIDRRGRKEGKVHEVLTRANQTVVGRYFVEHGVGFVIPDNKRLVQDISVPIEMSMQAKHGQMVLVEIVAFPSERTQPIGKIIHILGDHMAPGMEISVAICAHGIPEQWPEEVLQEVAKISQHVTETDLKNRKDLRDLPFVTIDGEDARDFDDAIYCQQKPKGGFQLYVAIADVSHYVKPGSALDNEAKKRGNSVYFPGKVVPMLPEALSNGICSLNPNVDRLCMVAELSIDAEGQITRSRCYRAVFKSQARLTYTQVWHYLSKTQPIPQHLSHLEQPLLDVYALYHAFLKARQKRGAIDFDTLETKIEFDEDKKIESIAPLIRNDAHRLIEECMLAANISVAMFLQKADLPVLYRVHQTPDEDKLIALRQFLGEWGLTLSGGETPSAKDFQKTMALIKDKPEKVIIETVMLRSLKQAQYTDSNEGHFGLAYPCYTHFTSPIRRYPDLLIHRALGAVFDRVDSQEYIYSKEEMNKLGKHCSMTERRADEATREVVAWLKCEYMQGKLGQEFEGTISAVTSFGLFVSLKDIYVEGLVHVTSLNNDYYEFDKVKHRLVGTRGGHVYRLGDTMRVLVASVNLDDRKIDFEPVEPQQSKS